MVFRALYVDFEYFDIFHFRLMININVADVALLTERG